MIKTDTCYPLIFEPVFVPKVWAGNLLYGVPEKTGEVWTIVDRENQQSVVCNGFYEGRTLRSLISEMPEQILGMGRQSVAFPLLVKLINAGEKLSVQVHPGASGPDGSQSKSEMWYILDSLKGAEVFIGFRDEYSLDEVKESMCNSSVAKLLNCQQSEIGESYYIPAGTVHALGAGNLVLEIQQNSDSTYRMYDWGRVGDDGLPRELHISRALSCIKPVRYRQGVNWEIEQPSFSLKEIIDTDWSTVFEISGNYSLNCRHESCFIVSAVSEIVITYGDIKTHLAKGYSSLIPACLNGVKIEGEKWLLSKVK